MPKARLQEDVIAECIQIHGNKNDYSQAIYNGMNTKFTVICKKHNKPFYPKPSNHIYNKSGCPICSVEEASERYRTPINVWKDACSKKHNNKYDYCLVDQFSESHEIVTIICPIHGEFLQAAYSHLAGKECPDCGKLKQSKSTKGISKPQSKETLKKIKSDYLKKLKERGIVYRPKNIEDYTKQDQSIVFVCPEHGDFDMSPVNVLIGCKCPACNSNGKSSYESMIIEEIGIPCIQNDRSVLSNKEIDILYKEKKVAIEVNGLYWHSDKSKKPKESTYHLNKTKECEEQGVQLLHFWDSEIKDKKDIVLSLIRSKLGITDEKIAARKCSISEVSSEDAKRFLDQNHMQGSGAIGSIRYGLYYNDELVSLMTFSKSRYKKEYDYELIRFCNKLNTIVVGGASKLFKYANLTSVVSYANRRWSNGNLYKQLGFDFLGNSEIGYVYTNGTKILSRQAVWPDNIRKTVGEIYDETKSQQENMKLIGYYRAYDCGNMIFGFKK